MTTNLGAPQVADNQDQKEITINDAVGRLDSALTDTLGIAIDSSNAASVGATDLRSHFMFDCTDGGLSAAATITFAASVIRGLILVRNSCGQTVTMQVSGQGGTPPTIDDGHLALLNIDGSTAVKLLDATA